MASLTSWDFSPPSRYVEILEQTLKLLVPECTATFVHSENGSGYGAALVAAVEMRLKRQREGVDQILAPFRLSMVELEKLRNMMRHEMEKGLSKETNKKASVRMLPTYVCHLPDGTGEGRESNAGDQPRIQGGNCSEMFRRLGYLREATRGEEVAIPVYLYLTQDPWCSFFPPTEKDTTLNNTNIF